MQYNLVLFDLDGTLIDTLADLAEAVNHALGLRGYPLHRLEEYRRMVGHGVRNLVKQALPEGAGEALVDAALADFKAYYTAHIDVHTRPYPGMQELLRDLHVAILGNREGYPLKPDPEIVGEVLRAAGVPRASAILVGDSGTDMKTAENGGIAAIAVGWGYRPMEASEKYRFAGSVTELRTLLFGPA